MNDFGTSRSACRTDFLCPMKPSARCPGRLGAEPEGAGMKARFEGLSIWDVDKRRLLKRSVDGRPQRPLTATPRKLLNFSSRHPSAPSFPSRS
jgi:hypothetical protein